MTADEIIAKARERWTDPTCSLNSVIVSSSLVAALLDVLNAEVEREQSKWTDNLYRVSEVRRYAALALAIIEDALK